MTTTATHAHEIAKVLGDNETIEKVNVWIARGDGVAAYRNEDLGSLGAGDMQFVSFGSPAAMLEVDEPPVQLPDIGHAINWRFRLAATYRGERLIPLLPTPDEVSWATPFEVCDSIVKGFDGHDPKVTEWGLNVTTMFSVGEETDAKACSITLHLGTAILIWIRCWVTEDGVNRLAPFYWIINDTQRDTRDGSDPNLGGAIVSLYNATLRG